MNTFDIVRVKIVLHVVRSHSIYIYYVWTYTYTK